jgi:hypothetical protein
MNVYLFFSAIFASTMAIGHSLIGHFAFFKPLRNAYQGTVFGDGDVTRRLVLGGWDFLAIPLGMTAIALFILAFSPTYFDDPKFITRLVFWHYIGQAVILLWYQLPRPTMFIRSPLWIGTIGIPILIFFGTDAIRNG